MTTCPNAEAKVALIDMLAAEGGRGAIGIMTLTVNEDFPTVVGVPEIVPAVPDKKSPGGS